MNNIYPHEISFDKLLFNLGKSLEKTYGEDEIPTSVLKYYSQKADKLDMFID